MLQLKPFDQSVSHCGPASLKIVLDYFGIEATERELGKLAGTTETDGTLPEGLVRAAAEFGVKATIREGGTVEQLKEYLDQGVPVIVGWFNAEEGHFSVVMDMDSENIVLQDPTLGHPRAFTLDRFKGVWFNFPGESSYRTREGFRGQQMIVFEKPAA